MLARVVPGPGNGLSRRGTFLVADQRHEVQRGCFSDIRYNSDHSNFFLPFGTIPNSRLLNICLAYSDCKGGKEIALFHTPRLPNSSCLRASSTSLTILAHWSFGWINIIEIIVCQQIQISSGVASNDSVLLDCCLISFVNLAFSACLVVFVASSSSLTYEFHSLKS